MDHEDHHVQAYIQNKCDLSVDSEQISKNFPEFWQHDFFASVRCGATFNGHVVNSIACAGCAGGIRMV